jgi:hypothetical protein
VKSRLRRWFDKLTGKEARIRNDDSKTMRLESRTALLDAVDRLKDVLKDKQ